MNILISACLLGVHCKYNGDSNKNAVLQELMKKTNFVPICPEQLGGLTTPRLPAEIVGDRVLNKQCEDVTPQFIKGAQESLDIARLYDCAYAILKERSPSCGGKQIYDGSFSGKVKAGRGKTADLLELNGIKVYSEENFTELFEQLSSTKNE